MFYSGFCSNRILKYGLFGANMTSSSSIDASHVPDHALLTTGTGYWQPATNDLTEWFQVSRTDASHGPDQAVSTTGTGYWQPAANVKIK